MLSPSTQLVSGVSRGGKKLPLIIIIKIRFILPDRISHMIALGRIGFVLGLGLDYGLSKDYSVRVKR